MDFSHSKTKQNKTKKQLNRLRQFFSRNLRKSRPISKGFLPQKQLNLQFLGNFEKWDPPLRICWPKMGLMSKDFWWKSNPFGRHIPVCFNMWVPLPGGYEFSYVGPIGFCVLYANWKVLNVIYQVEGTNNNGKEIYNNKKYRIGNWSCLVMVWPGIWPI